MLAPLLAVLLTGALLLLPATFLAGYDYGTMHELYREYFRRALLAGEFPWWNPYTALGRPFFADIETACAYPPTWLVLPFGITAGVVLVVALHLAIALAGTHRLATALGASALWAWLGAITFAASGAVLARLQLGQLTVFCSLCWLPWLFVVARQLPETPGPRACVRLALLLGACFLAGSPNVLWIGLVGLGVFVLAGGETWRTRTRSLGVIVAATVLAAGLTAVQLFSFVELVAQGNRPLAGAAYAARHGMHLTTWLSTFVPAIGPIRFAPEFNAHLGAPFVAAAALLFVTGWRRPVVRGLLAVAGASVVLAAGDWLPVLPWLADHFPGFGSMRFPSRYAVLAVLAGAVAGAIALSRFTAAPRTRPTLAFTLAGLQLAFIAFAAVQISLRDSLPMAGFWDTHLRADLQAHGLFTANGVPPRVAFPPEHVRPNSGLVQGYSTLDGFANPMLRSVWDAAHREAGVTPPDFALHALHADVHRVGPFPVPSAALVAGWDAAARATLMRPPSHAPPRAWLAADASASGPALPLPRTSVEIAEFTRNSIGLTTRTPRTAFLVLAEPFYPGWHAAVAGRAVAVELSHAWMRRVPVPAGESLVHLTFRPRFLALGAAVSLLSAVVAGLLWRHGRATAA